MLKGIFEIIGDQELVKLIATTKQDQQQLKLLSKLAGKPAIMRLLKKHVKTKISGQ